MTTKPEKDFIKSFENFEKALSQPAKFDGVTEARNDFILNAAKYAKTIQGKKSGKEFFVVFNRARNEGVMFDNEQDAKHAANIRRVRQLYSSLAEHFNESYCDQPGDKLKVEKIIL